MTTAAQETLASTMRKGWMWFLIKSGVLRWFILSILAVGLFLNWVIPATQPALMQVATNHAIYLPTNVAIVNDVQNILNGNDIAVMQIEVSTKNYKMMESGYSLHYLTIKDSITKNIVMDYYAKAPNSTHVIHTRDIITSPEANKWGIYSPTGKMSISNRELIVQRNFSRNDSAIFAIIFCLVLTIILITFVNNLLLTRGLRKIYQNYFKT